MVVNILLHASPLDLLQVQLTSRYFRDILEANPHLWRLARRSLIPPVPDPVLPTNMYERSRNWSESAYANLIFGGSKCSFCGDDVRHMWAHSSYSLRHVDCSKKECISARHRDRIPLPKLKPNSPWYIRQLALYLPFLEGTGDAVDLRRYSRMQIMRVKEEASEALGRFQRGKPVGAAFREVPELREFRRRLRIRKHWLYAIMETAKALTIWQREWARYTISSGLFERGEELVKGCIIGKNIKFTKISNSITFKRWQIAFFKSQTAIDHSAWYHIEGQVLCEVAKADAGIVRLPIAKGWTGKIQCPFCPKVELRPHIFSGAIALSNHVRNKHPQYAKMVIQA